MGRRRTVVVKQKRGCLVTAILVLVLILLLIIVVPWLVTCLGVVAVVATHDGDADSEDAGTPGVAKGEPERGAEAAKPLEAEPEPPEEEPKPPPPPEWDAYRIDKQPDASGSEKENKERLLKYLHATNRAVNSVRFEKDSPVHDGFRGYCETIYPKLMEAEPSLAKLPKWVQAGFMMLMHKKFVDDSMVQMMDGLHKLAKEWAEK